jgi:hypothetical protein
MEGKIRLLAKLTAKRIEIQAIVAKNHHMGKLSELSPMDFGRLEVLTDEGLQGWELAHRNGDPATRDDAAFNRLARQYFEIKNELEGVR